MRNEWFVWMGLKFVNIESLSYFLMKELIHISLIKKELVMLENNIFGEVYSRMSKVKK